MWAPCRKCPKCLQFRQMKWRERIINEILLTHNRGRRSWFVTLTFSPVHLAGVLAEATRLSGSSPRETRHVDKAAYRHVQGYLDRLRKASKSPFRYVAVFEQGEKTGRSHYHLVIHEGDKKPILKRTLDNLWHSHVHARLLTVDEERSISQVASYVSTYATKTQGIRIRASVSYGSPLRAGAVR